jgi:outer membrane protein assembly factor BamD
MNFNGFRKLSQVAFLVGLALLVARCSSTPTTADGAELLYQEAEEAFQDERYLVALEKFREVKNRFPQSPRAVDAELRVADTYFAQEAFIEAESAYEIFRELHPAHPKNDYVHFRIAMSAYEQIPSNPARDLTAAHRAIDGFQVVLAKYPGSEFAKDAKRYIDESRRRLAEHESYVADFYFRRQHFLSASYRYAALLQDFPDLGFDEEAMFRLGKCYYQTRMYASARDTLRRFAARFPKSAYRSEAESLLGAIGDR